MGIPIGLAERLCTGYETNEGIVKKNLGEEKRLWRSRFTAGGSPFL
jgi:hypothetical protein